MPRAINKEDFKAKVQLALKTVKEYQTPNTKTAIIQILNSFGPYLLLWILIYNLWDYSKIGAISLMFLNALFLVRIFIIQHDCGHQSFIQSKRWRDIIGFGCSLVSSIPYKYWAKSHHFHHAHNGMLEVRDIGDIDTLTVKEFASLSKTKRFWYRLYRSHLVMFVIGPIYYIIIHNRLPLIKLPEFKEVKKSLWTSNAVYVAVLVGLCLIFDWQKFLLVHFMILSFFAIIAIWFFYIQHQHEESYKHWKENWEYIVAAIKGSSYYKLPKIMNWFTGNIAIHHIHHLNPAIPNYNLKKCVDAIPWLNDYTTEITFWESLKLAANKLWDENQQRMITLKEFYTMEKQGLLS